METHPYTGAQILLRLREAGFKGGKSIVNDYVHKVRPTRTQAFLTLSFAPGECAQVDWGQFGSIAAGNTKRRLSFFVMVLCYSRMLYVEFTLSETMEHFLACHQNAVGYIKKNFLSGLEISDFKLMNPSARLWLETIANVRSHG